MVFGQTQELLGQIVWTQVAREPGESEIKYLVKGKYNGKITTKYHLPKYREKIARAMNGLKNGKIINCEVKGFNNKKEILELKWMIELDTEIVLDRSIMNNLDNETLQKLTAIKNEAIAQQAEAGEKPPEATGKSREAKEKQPGANVT